MLDLGAGSALLRFQLRTGVRVALRATVPVAAAATAAAVIYGSPLVVLAPLAAVLFPPAPSVPAAMIAGMLAVGLSLGMAPRLTTGLDGWIRHLPASVRAHRLSVTAGLVVAQGPFLLLVTAAGLSTLGEEPTVGMMRLLGLPLLAWSSALAAVPAPRRTRFLALVAAGLSLGGAVWALTVAVGLLVAAEAPEGGLVVRRGRHPAAARRLMPSLAGSNADLLWLIISFRALGGRTLGHLGLAVLALVPVLFFLNNNRLAVAQEMLAVRLAGLIAATLVIGATADALVRRRPPWPWVRSLPWSSRRRVAVDASLLGAVALPAVVVAGLLRPVTMASMLAGLVFLALRGATAIRSGRARASGASGQLMAEGFLCAAAVALVPWSALAVAALTPVALHLAATAEQEQDVSRWHELHHLAAGDSTSWSGS